MDSMEDIPILIFARAPIAGKSKRRLIPALGPEGAARLHSRMLKHVVGVAHHAAVGPVFLYATPTTEHSCFATLAQRYPLELRLQQGVDLGKRMAAAFDAVLPAYSGAILVGSDCPGIRTKDLQQLARALRDGVDSVLGPTEDGGYCLIGLREAAPRIFQDISWGSETVLAETRDKLTDSALHRVELAPKRDIDRPADLEALPLGWPEYQSFPKPERYSG